VILNLLVNARDAMPDGGQLFVSTAHVELDGAFVRRHPGAQAGPHVALVIRDTGVGMDPVVCARIFEPFFTTKGPDKGTGLGLATVYGIVSQHGGTLAVESEPGRGSTFTIYLAAIQGEASGECVGAVAPARQGAETVLLAEDNPLLRELVVEMLERSGYTVIEARHGRDALEQARAYQGPIDLLLSDVVMPEMSGPELVSQLASTGRRMRVLLVSGYPAEELQDHGPEMPGAAFLAKPFTPDRLLRKVREVLDAQDTLSEISSPLPTGTVTENRLGSDFTRVR
jgi:CheY-like chemotaxis protein